MKKCGSRSSVHTTDGFTSISLLRVDEHLILPELRPGVSRRLVGCHGGRPTGKRAAAHEWRLHHGMLWQRAHVRALLALYPRARPPAALHRCCGHLNRSRSSLVLARAEASRCIGVEKEGGGEEIFFKPDSPAEPVVCAGRGNGQHRSISLRPCDPRMLFSSRGSSARRQPGCRLGREHHLPAAERRAGSPEGRITR